MFAKRLNDLAERKRLIVLQTGFHRLLLDLECASLRARLDSVRANVTAGAPWLLAAGAVAGLITARRWRGLGRWIPTALAAWRWFQRLQTHTPGCALPKVSASGGRRETAWEP